MSKLPEILEDLLTTLGVDFQEQIDNPDYWVKAACRMLDAAYRAGWIVTINTTPLPGQPLAMGRYGMAIEVRHSRPRYQDEETTELRESLSAKPAHEFVPSSGGVQ
jgi:hypothetical protein